MTKRTLLGVAAILSTAIATPALAQAVFQEPGAVVDPGTADAMASLPFPGSSMAGNETTTRPWSPPAACGRHSPINVSNSANP